MLFLALFVFLVATRSIEGDGMMAVGFAAFCEVLIELAMFSKYLGL